jgi:hypothetical protein
MKLLEQVRDVIRKKHYSILTEQAYVEWIRRFILFHKKQHPKDMGEKEISQFISHLATDRNVAAGHEPGTDLESRIRNSSYFFVCQTYLNIQGLVVL